MDFWALKKRNWEKWEIEIGSREGCEGPHDHDQTEHICGRPLGLMFSNVSGDLYIADCYMGLLKVGQEGGVATRVAMEAGEVPLSFTNSLDIDPLTGVVYFTDSSLVYQRRYVRIHTPLFTFVYIYFLKLFYPQLIIFFKT